MDDKTKLISINGVIKVQSDTDHQEFIQNLFRFLKQENYHFQGKTKIEEGNIDDGNNERSD